MIAFMLYVSILGLILSSAKRLLSFKVMPLGIITFLFRFSQRVQPIDCYSLNNTDLFWQTLLLGISFNIEAFLIDSEEFVFEQCVRLFCNVYKLTNFALPNFLA